MRSRGGRFGSILIGLVLIAVPVVAWLERQNLYDAWRLHDYQAPTSVVQLADETTMNPATRRVFYVQHPELDDRSTFSGHCGGNEQTIVLGCYIAFKGIYIFDVQDPRLNGVKEVTAAHELLHAEYDRLSASDKQYVDTLITQAYATVTDQRIKDTIAAYRKAGADTTNELHSILGTEVRNLPPALESYYTRYFTDRERIVSYSEQYEKVFTDTKDQVAQDDTKLASLKDEINVAESSLAAQAQQLTAQHAQLDSLLASRQIAAYNAAVPSFNAAVGDYNNQVATLKHKIDQYNQLVNARNAIALEEQSLVQAIDSRSAPQTVPSSQ